MSFRKIQEQSMDDDPDPMQRVLSTEKATGRNHPAVADAWDHLHRRADRICLGGAATVRYRQLTASGASLRVFLAGRSFKIHDGAKVHRDVVS
jgi:hypothetical protein